MVGISSCMFGGIGMYSSHMDRFGMASGAHAFHRHSLYSSSEHLKHPPPYLMQAAARACAHTDCSKQGSGRTCGRGSKGRGRQWD
jgi:hypothetical protein